MSSARPGRVSAGLSLPRNLSLLSSRYHSRLYFLDVCMKCNSASWILQGKERARREGGIARSAFPFATMSRLGSPRGNSPGGRREQSSVLSAPYHQNNAGSAFLLQEPNSYGQSQVHVQLIAFLISQHFIHDS